MRIALVHDYLKEYGGAERVLEALCEIWPKAPIYTAFYKEGSSAYERFKRRKIVVSWVHHIPFFASVLHSPLRFLAPLIWNSFDFSDFDVVIGSSSWYVTKGFGKRDPSTHSIDSESLTRSARSGFQRCVEICYCHTPPRYLYGYPTSVEWQRYWPVRFYALVVNHFMRVYDFEAAQKVDYFIANSKEVQARIKKFYRRESTVIYPPVDVRKFAGPVSRFLPASARSTSKSKLGDQEANLELRAVGSPSTTATRKYFLVVSRLVASKKVDIVVEVCAKLGLPLKVVGEGRELENLKAIAERFSGKGDNNVILSGNEGSRDLDSSTSSQNDSKGSVEFLGEVSDKELIGLYQNCRAVIFPAQMEDFGIVPVEAMACGKPVIANAEGGVLETVIDGIPAGKGKGTGVYFDPPTTGSLTLAINNFVDLEKKGYFDPKFIRRHAQKFSKDRFKREILRFVEDKVK